MATPVQSDAPSRAASPLTPEPLRQLPVTLRPDSRLLTYYLLSAFVFGPVFPVMIGVLYFRYHTLRYDVDEEGLTMRWGILFRREVSLTYARIQDIHLTSNVIERWLGLAKVQVQTASGSAQAEMSIEGLSFFEAMRDFLYARMRGARKTQPAPRAVTAGSSADVPGQHAELVAALREVATEVRALREELRAGGRRDE